VPLKAPSDRNPSRSKALGVHHTFRRGTRKSEKLALGLPRNIGRRGVDQETIEHPAGRSYARHASPLHFRLVRNSNGYSVRVTALPSPHLPDLKRSREYLERCMDHLYDQLQ